MKLPSNALTVQEQLAEFDVWVTPSLGDIRDTDRFRDELDLIVSVFDVFAEATADFSSESSISSDSIADLVVAKMKESSDGDCIRLLSGLSSLLFLVTGKSDNNAKCQLPLFLRDHASWPGFPSLLRGEGSSRVVFGPIPRVLKAERLIATVVSLRQAPEQQRKLLHEFVEFVLSTTDDVRQLWSIGRSYVIMKQIGRHRELLTPIVVFQVRGSVSASGGHGPESLLRAQMTSWGMIAGVEFNVADVVVGGSRQSSSTSGKTRAYDFVLPYDVAGQPQSIFCQCQFYAGDSGSVSHKNVDQTSTSRRAVSSHVANPRFVEYVDGAGYFSSLNGDLNRLLSMEDTASFIQIRTAAIRLRRELQRVGYIAPVDVAHAAMISGDLAAASALLRQDGYAPSEVDRAVQAAIDRGVVVNDGSLCLGAGFQQVAKSLFLLDTAANRGEVIANGRAASRGCLLIPGFGPFFGLRTDQVIRDAAQRSPALRKTWNSPESAIQDIQWLVDQGFAMMG